MSFLLLIALFVPLAAAIVIVSALRKFPRAAAFISIGACGVSLLCAVLISWGYGAESAAWSGRDHRQGMRGVITTASPGIIGYPISDGTHTLEMSPICSNMAPMLVRLIGAAKKMVGR